MPTDLVGSLKSGAAVFGAELRPPRAELEAGEGMDAWIDTYHAVRRLTRQGTFVFLTDSAVGAHEEDNLRHLVANLGGDAPHDHVVPILTTKHSRDYCLSYAERAHQNGFRALVVLGGDRRVGPPRCVEHAWQLRRVLRDRDPSLALGGWANPNADPERQVDFVAAPEFTAEFVLTQVVSHHAAAPVAQFVKASEQRRVGIPIVYGVFYYRSANRRTLDALSGFLPVPVDALVREFAGGASADEICARTIRTMMDAGARHFYISNLPVGRAQAVLDAIRERVGVAT